MIVRHDRGHHRLLLTLLALAPLVAGCQSASDLMSKDAEWFSRSGRLFIRNVSIDAPPLTPDQPVRPDDLVSADGACPGMAPPGAGRKLSLITLPAAPPVPGGTVALGHTECDVVRGIGAPDSVNLSNGPGGAPRRRHLVARSARRHLHLQRRTAFVDRARARAGRTAESGEKAEEETRRDLIVVVQFQHSHAIAAGTCANVGIERTTRKYLIPSGALDLTFACVRAGRRLANVKSAPLVCHSIGGLIFRACLQPFLLGASQRACCIGASLAELRRLLRIAGKNIR